MRHVLFLRSDLGSRHSIEFSGRFTIYLASFILLVMLGAAFFAGLNSGQNYRGSPPGNWSQLAQRQAAEIEAMRARLQERVMVIATRIGQVNAHVIRLDALGKRLADMANIDSREFDFDRAPAIGGPEGKGLTAQIPDLNALLDQLEFRISQRDAQLGVLESLISQRQLREQIVPDGRPVRRGFISSYFGGRQDPFDGRDAFHSGLDFAGSSGDEVISVAAGVVTYAAPRNGYGQVVDVTHGDGYVTRYAHNERILVKLGDTVVRGQALALMGSTGRSTGPHVHFEVLRNGRAVNPLTYIGG